jgi:uncharacterized OsmC-like protein
VTLRGMSVRIDVEYNGDLRCTSTHGPSRTQLLTDAPADNQGRGESFSPTDLAATALASCMLTTMAIFAERHTIDLRGATASVEKEMIADPLRRICKLTTVLNLPVPKDHPHREALERAALTCPVHRSLGEDVEKPVTFVWK